MRTIGLAFAVMYFALGPVCPALVQAATPPPAAPVQVGRNAGTPDDAAEADRAKALLLRMADTLASAQAFSVTVEAGYDVVQDSGQKIEFGEVRHVHLSRPDKLRIDTRRSDGTQQQVIFDGKALTMFSPGDDIYGKLEHPGTVDEIVRTILEDLQTPIPLSVLLVSSIRQELESRVTEVSLVETTEMAGAPAEHVAARTADVDFQVWITDGDRPLPLRVVITYKHAPGQPQFWALLRDWDFAAADPAVFTFTPPPDAEAVPFMVHVAKDGSNSGVGR